MKRQPKADVWAGVNIAARLESLAESGGVCISKIVHDLVKGELDIRYQDLGAQKVKNIPDPIHCYRVVLEGARAWVPLTVLAAGRF